MNSKILSLLLFISILTGCGVKSDPLKYPEIAIDSYINEYTGKGPTTEQLEKAIIIVDSIIESLTKKDFETVLDNKSEVNIKTK